MSKNDLEEKRVWDDKAWHHRVHERLGEILFYYFVRVSPRIPSEAKAKLRYLIAEKQLGSIRVFPIFGSYDLLMRAWLHPSVATHFASWLDSTLSNCQVVPFAVTHIDRRWYWNDNDPEIGINRYLLEHLNEDRIRAVQSLDRSTAEKDLTDKTSLLSQLVDGRIVIRRESEDKPKVRF